MGWTFDGSLPTFDHGAGYTFDGSSSSGAPVITANPSNASVTAPATATFTANATGYTSVQWQTDSGSSGTTWSNISGATSTSYTTGATSALTNGWQYRAVFTNGSGSTDTLDATLTVTSVPIVIVNPLSQVIQTGSTATLSSVADGYPVPTVQWQTDSGTGGVTWSNISGATSSTYVTGVLTSAENGWEYRAVFTNTQGSATSAAATLAVVSIISTGVKPMQFVFGPGNLIVTPLTDAYGNTISPTTPRKLGAFQEASFDTSSENKMLYGPNQFPLAVGRGKAKVGLKVKAAQFSIDQWNAIYIGQPVNQTAGIIAAYVDAVGSTIPATPYQITPVTTYASYLTGTSPAFDYDLGVADGSGNAYKAVTGTPTTGQYAVAGGVYTFAAADTGKTVFISFAYTATNAAGAKNAYVNINNLPMGQAPFLQVDLSCVYGGNQLFVTLFQAIASKLSFATKLDDFAIPDLEFDGFANSANVAYRIAAGQ
jgi:hypothetical protein